MADRAGQALQVLGLRPGLERRAAALSQRFTGWVDSGAGHIDAVRAVEPVAARDAVSRHRDVVGDRD